MAETALPPEERDALAAELALGLLDGDERAGALRRLLADPDFTHDMIDAWHRRLAPLYDHYVPVTPPDRLWAGIQAGLVDRVVPRDGIARQLRLWRAGTIAAGAIAATLALMLMLRPVPAPIASPAAPQIAIAQMAGAPDGPVILARFEPSTGRLILRPSGVQRGTLAPELWVIPADGKPRSLGLIAADADSHVVIDRAHRIWMTEGATLAVTMEPATGAPHDAPSSAPVAVGKISLI